MAEPFSFAVKARDGAARCGEIRTSRGIIRTPAFMPVGTAATVKAVYADQVRASGADVILGNTYHLMLRPGSKLIRDLGGLHRFMNWGGPILTDSGGFQIMSLSKLRKMSEKGVVFQSHIDGSRHELTPERSVEIQCELGADIQMAFDECTPFPATHEQARESMELSMRWAARSKEAFKKYGAAHQALFGIVQGSIYEDLRRRSVETLLDIGFPGYAIGGLAVGEGQEAMMKALDFAIPLLPWEKPRYLMGVGTPLDIIEAVRRGVDMFDCVMPTRSGRHGQVFTWKGTLNLRNARFANDPEPIDAGSDCPARRDYSKAYIHHLIKAREYLAPMLLSWANIAFYQELMKEIRLAINQGRLDELALEVGKEYNPG
jgi:queuine tRNA-ribosyltransferase